MMLSDADPAKIMLPYVHRADEIQNYEPLVAYHCRLYAMNRVQKLPKKERTKSTDELVVSLMKEVEKDKKFVQLSSDDGRYVEGFATKLFMKADKQERCGKANLNTAKTFYAASLFFEILHNFGDFPFAVEQKQKYAAWKAAEIRKALKKVRKPLAGPPAGDEAFPVSDGRVVNSESLSEKVAANSQEQSFPLEKLPAMRLEIDAEQDQVPFSSNQSCENLSDPRFILDIQNGGNISTSNCYQQDSSDDDQSFHSCSEEPEDDVLFPNDTCSRLDQTIHTPADVQGQIYHPSAAEIADNCMHFSNSTGRRFERTISTLFDVEGQHYHPSAAEIADHDGLLSNDTRSGLDHAISAPADVQGKHYHPSAAEIAKALKVSRFAVSALAVDDVPSAVSYLKQALDLLTNPPQIQS